MSKVRVLLSLMVVALLALGFIAGCGSSSDDGGGSDNSTGTITGTVTDQNNQPISGALCTVTTTDAKGYVTDTTDNSGVYQLLHVPVGSWPMTITATGFVTQTQTVTVTGGQTSEVPDVQMPVQGYGTVSGTVYSELIGGTTISGATVTVGTVTVTSGTTGTYSAADVAAGTQTVSATATGYVAYSSTVTVVADTTVSKDITMTPSSTASPTPSPGYGNVSGKVIDANGAGIADVTISLQKGTATTDSNGAYLMENLTPGVRTLAYAKTGYDSKTQDVTVEADTTVTVATVTLSTGTPAGTTTWVSKRINLPEVNNAIDPDVSNDGSKVAFTSSGNVIVNWNNPANPLISPKDRADVGLYQIYVWTRATGTITRVSNNNLVSGSTAGGNRRSNLPAISGNGEYVVFKSIATDILPNGLATTNNGDIFIVRLSDLAIARITNSAANANNGGDAASGNPEINGDGTKVVFMSTAQNIGNITVSAGFNHVYYVTVTDMVPGVRRMLDITTASAEGTDGGANPQSNNPSVSYDGRYVAYQSIADNITSAGAGYPASLFEQIFLCDVNADPATGWNTLVSKHNGTISNTPSLRPAINEGGTRIAFESQATTLGNSSATSYHIYMWSQNNTALTWVSIPLSGTVGNSTMAVMDRTGQYVGFLSTTVGLVSDVTNNIARVYVKDVNSGANTYTLVSRGSSDQVPDVDCDNPSMSGDGNYVVWQTASKNLTNDSYTTNIVDVFARKWK
ncbi:MAG: carboxypeptidase regulatory-like domain-containing protein [Firmicutes bacterium]|nr:carboxypeptidase regulatory-like domain-containing protein [Bacillota bacterium]